MFQSSNKSANVRLKRSLNAHNIDAKQYVNLAKKMWTLFIDNNIIKLKR